MTITSSVLPFSDTMHRLVVSRRLVRIFLWSWIVLTSASLAGCLIPERPTECRTDRACTNQYGPTSYCADDGICDVTECSSDQECRGEFGAGARCTDRNTCKVRSCSSDDTCKQKLGSTASCNDNGYCEVATCEEGDDVACQQQFGPTGYCKQGRCRTRSKEEYLAEPCDFKTTGPVLEKGTYNVGVVMAHSQVSREPLRGAVQFAQSDINGVDGIDGHPLGLIYCDTKGKTETARDAVQHLADIGVQAIVGPDFSSYTVEVTPDLIAPNEILTISPTATSSALSSIQDDGFFWRTAPSNAIQTPQLGRLVENLITDVIPNEIQPDRNADNVEVAMMTRKNDAYAGGIQSGVVRALPSRIVKRIETTTYPNSGEADNADYTAAAEQIAENEPDLVMLWGLEEVWEVMKRLDTKIEDKLGEPPETIYVMADGGKSPEKAKEIVPNRPSLVGRVWGTAPRAKTDGYNPYKTFRFRFRQNTEYEPSSSFITNAYDAVFLVGFAAAASDSFRGSELAEGMKKLTDSNGTEVVASQEEFPRGVDLLSKGESIDFAGVSGPIEFDSNGDPKDWNISLWCLQKTSDGNNTFAINDVGLLHEIGSSDFNMQRCRPTN